MLNSIQTLRALAAWMVVFHHCSQLIYSDKLSNPIISAFYLYGSIGVDIFFIISGFVIYISASGKNVTPTTFAMHRLARIAPAYWLFTLITAGFLLFSPHFVLLTQVEPLFLLKSLFFIPAQNPSGIGPFPLITMGWTLNLEMAFYAIFLLSLYAPKNFRVPLIALGVFTLCTLVPLLGGDLAFYENKIVYEFLFGILVAITYQKGWIQSIPSKAAFALLFLSIFLIVRYGPVSHKLIKSGLPCALLLISAVALEKYFSRAAFIAKLGDWSYSTYLCHVLAISSMYRLQKSFNLNDGVTLALIVATVLATSYLSFTFVEKPVSNLAKKRFRTRPQATPATATV